MATPPTAGVVLHFDQPLIADYFIVDPQRWFDLCALVIAPDNVSSLVMNTGRLGGKSHDLSHDSPSCSLYM